MREKGFRSISVKSICESCGINRKSFYYHYRDKFDLVNDIYSIEFYENAARKSYDSIWIFFDELCIYIDENRKFYRNAFNVDGQNSFRDYFCDSLEPMLTKHYAQQGYSEREAKRMACYFSVMLSAAVVNWLGEKKPMSAEEFSRFVHVLCSGVCEGPICIKDYTHSDTRALPYAFN